MFGEPRYWLAQGRYFYGPQGELLRSVGVTQDITSMHLAEEALSQTGAILNSFYNAASILMGVVELEEGDDSDVFHVHDNAAAERYFGLAPGSTRGRSARSLGAPDEVIRQWVAHYRRSQAELRPITFSHAHGSGQDTRHWSAVVAPVAGTATTPTRRRFAYAASDITEHVATKLKLEQTLAQAQSAERTLQALLDYLPEGICIADAAPDVRIRAVSRYGQSLVQRPGEELVGAAVNVHMDLWDLYRPDGSRPPPEDLPLSRAVLHGEVIHNEELVLRRRDGTEVTLLCSAGPIRDADGDVKGGVIAWRDIEQLKQLDCERTALLEALRLADRRKDEFLATLSHELRNPLAPIRTATHLLTVPNAPADVISHARAVIGRQVDTMALLLDDLLDVARVTQGKLVLRVESVHLHEVIDAAVEAVRPHVERKRQSLDVQLPAGPTIMQADRLRLAQVVTNLLTNACKYSDPGGSIRLSAQVTDARVQISVSDDGIGIPADKLGTIFDMFNQLDSAHRRAEGGLGIGLALVKGLVGLHNGTAIAESPGLGQGSRFTIFLPRGSSDAPDAEALLSETVSASGAVRVLVVDDNKDGADMLARLLEVRGHVVRVTYNGRAALALAPSFRPQVAFVDIGMPEMSGHELAIALREHPWSADTLMVALSGWGTEQDKSASERAGFHRHLTKPVDVTTIDALMRDAAQRR